MCSEAAGIASARRLKRAQVPFIAATVMPPGLFVAFAVSVREVFRGAQLLDVNGFTSLGLDTGWYGFAGCATLLFGPVLYYVPRANYGGPSKPSCEAGDGAIARFEPRAAEDS